VDSDGIPNHYVPIDREQHGIKANPNALEAMSLLQLESMPTSFDWRDVGGQSYVSVPRFAPSSLALQKRRHQTSLTGWWGLQEPAYPSILWRMLGLWEVA